MRSKISLIALGVRVSALSLLFFASFTASLYFPHQSLWGRVATIVMIVMFGVSAVRGCRRRIEVHTQNIGKDLGRA